jgi:hypothetical protein
MVRTRIELLFPAALLAAAAGLIAPASAASETFDLHVHPYCKPATLCGYATEADMRLKILKIVQEVNLEFEVAGISFRPILFPIDDTVPDFYETTGCYTGDGKRRCDDYTTECSKDSQCNLNGCRYCTGDCVCEDVATTCSEWNDCTGIFGGTCGPRSWQRRNRWRREVADLEPNAITIMVTPPSSSCCSPIPDLSTANDPNMVTSGIYCNGYYGTPARDTGPLWAHEMSHHFCLPHTFTMQDPIEVAPNPVDHEGDGLTDTPPDPTNPERTDHPLVCPDLSLCQNSGDCFAFGECARRDDVFGDQRDFCLRVVQYGANDDGSPHPDHCAALCKRCINGPCNVALSTGNLTPLGYQPLEHVAPSYYGRDCRGPFVLNGQSYYAFSPDQIDRVASCRSDIPDRANLPEVCGALGGDSDNDGICDDGDGSGTAGDNPCDSLQTTGCDDNCRTVKNTPQRDLDDDGDGDACDLCIANGSPTGDMDNDGIGDLCDPDRDGDGCNNGIDQHPDQIEFEELTITYTGCSSRVETVTYLESEDSNDPDLARHCRDLDDDDDGICDSGGPYVFLPGNGVPIGGCVPGPGGFDPCPVTSGIVCDLIDPGPLCPPDWLICLLTDCNESFIKITNVINPAPENEVIIDRFRIVNRSLYLLPPDGMTPSQMALSLQGIAGSPAGGAAFAPQAGSADPQRMEIWSRATNELVAVVVDAYDPAGIAYGEISRGTVVAVTPGDGAAAPPLAVATTYGVGVDPGDSLPDADGDGRPEWSDNCIMAGNFDQTDADDDGFGNACDADLDGDGVVTSDDVDAVQICYGADLTLQQFIDEPEEIGGFEHLQPDAAALQLAYDCVAADLNGDRTVDDADLLIAEGMLGSAPGPSAVMNHAPVADAGVDQSLACGTTVDLDGGASFDPDGHPLTCQWSSAACIIDDPNACATTAACPPLDTVVSLIVNDGTESSAPDQATITMTCAVPGRTPPTLMVSPSPAVSDNLILQWEADCQGGAQDYAIFEGQLGAPASHIAIDCSDDGADRSEEITPASGNRYYIVVPLDPQYEGSYGVDSAGVERPPGSLTCRPLRIVSACPSP